MLIDHDHLIGQVQHRARLTSRGGAEVAVRATLQTLEKRISEGTYQNLKAQLPRGIGDYQDSSDIDRRRPGERFSLDEFIDRVARREGVRKQDAASFMLGACLRSLTRPPRAEPRLTSRTSCRRSSGHYLRPEAGSRGEMKTN
jgi:uncharacterized protein (DUF2267 family)